MIPVRLNESINQFILNILVNRAKKGMKNDYAMFTRIKIFFGGEPDTIYRHSPAQYLVQFITFLCGVISLWTGFSVMSMYVYGKRLFNGQMKSNQEMNLFTRRTRSVSIVKNIYNLNGKKKSKKLFVRNKNFGKDIMQMQLSNSLWNRH